MINNPNFAERPTADHELVEFFVVIHAITVQPITPGRVFQRVIQVDQFRVVGNYAEVGLVRIEILNEVIPEFPLPHDIVGSRIHFNDRFPTKKKNHSRWRDRAQQRWRLLGLHCQK